MTEAKFVSNYKNKIINCVGQNSNQTLKYFPHYTNASSTLYLNDIDNENESDSDRDEDEQQISLISSKYPKLLHFPDEELANDNQQNVMRLVQAKAEFITDVGKTANLCLRDEKCKEKKVKDKKAPYTMHLKNLMELSVKDPDPYFYGSYNWYHTGGTLEIASINDIDFLFHVSGANLNIFNSSQITSHKSELEVKPLDKTSMSINSPIFEIIKSQDNRFVGVRQRNLFSTFYLHDENAQQDLPSLKNVPIISGEYHKNNLYTVDADRILRRFNLELSQETGRMHLKRAINKNYWCQLRRYNDQMIFAEQKIIKLYDCRLFGTIESKTMEMNLENIIEKCEDITCVRADMNENNLFIGTTHHLLVLDIRSGTKNKNQLTRYSHLLKSSPMFIDAVGGGLSGMLANERIVSLTGTFCEDSVLINHTKKKNTFSTVRVLSVNNTIDYLKRNGLLKEVEKINNLNNNVNIGSRLFRLKGKLFLITEKSSGDIFSQEIETNEHLEYGSNSISYEDENKLLQNIPNKPKRKSAYEVTTLTNFNSLKHILKYDMPNTDEMPDIQGAERIDRWKRSITNLQSYKDLLSADLLNVWEISDLKGERQMDSSTIVSGWLQNQQNF